MNKTVFCDANDMKEKICGAKVEGQPIRVFVLSADLVFIFKKVDRFVFGP